MVRTIIHKSRIQTIILTRHLFSRQLVDQLLARHGALPSQLPPFLLHLVPRRSHLPKHRTLALRQLSRKPQIRHPIRGNADDVVLVRGLYRTRSLLERPCMFRPCVQCS